jgi:long-chain acyl-CoA synthetase
MMTSLALLLTESAAQHPDRPAVRRDERVLTIPHPEPGEEIGAAVAFEAAADTADLREFVRSRVAAYEYPRRIWVADGPPKGPTGTILRREVTVPAEVLS